MLKRFGVAGVLFAVSAVAPLTAAAQDRNYSNHNQAQWTAPQAQHGVQVNAPRGGGYNNTQNFRGGAYTNNAQDFRGAQNDNYREPARNVTVNRDDRYSRFRVNNGHSHGPMPYRDFDRDDFRR